MPPRLLRASPLTCAPHPPTRRTRAALLATGALLLSGALAGPASASSGSAATTVQRSRTHAVSLFPSNDLTVRDPAQLTNKRVALPTAGCGSVPVCGLLERLNTLDGFDLDPRLALRFDAPVDPVAIAAAVTVDRADAAPGSGVGVDRVVYDAATSTVYAHPRTQLAPGTTYQLRLKAGHGVAQANTPFTTLSATDGLLDLRRQLDDGSAYRAAGIPNGARGLTVDAVVPAQGTTLGYRGDVGAAGLVDVPTFNASLAAGTYVFGSYLAPSWLQPDRTIAQTSTGDAGPRPTGMQRLPFLLVLPAGPAPAGGWPVAVFGHGFTRSDADVLLAAATNSAAGLATISTDVVGHGFGPRSVWTITRDGATTTVDAHARGVDLDGNGVITSTEGVSALPSGPAAAVGSRDGLRQTVADVSTLVRALGRSTGLDVDANGATDIRPGEMTYFGQSFGGIYGTMLAGVDPKVRRAVLNVAGGPITEISRLSPSFRPLTAQLLSYAGLLNGVGGAFTESLPLRGEPPVTDPAPGSLAIQDFLADTTWLDRPGSPETFAPLVRHDDVLFQVAYGDRTVPNPTSYTLLAAGNLFDRTALYRNDLTAQAATNPHGFLLTPTFVQGFGPGQAQVFAFLSAGAVIDPDGPGPVWEVPIVDPAVLLTLKF